MRNSSVFVTCIEAIIYLLLYNLHDRTFNGSCIICFASARKYFEKDSPEIDL